MTWLLTFTGKHFDLLDPQPDMIDLVDIAQGLANECRFAGQCKFYYSVAQHCEIASRNVAQQYALEALLHDAAEAYLKDIPRPLKMLLPDYRAIEHRVDLVIRERFGLPDGMSGAVSHIDRVLLATERRDLMPRDNAPWACLHGIQPLEGRISAINAYRAKSSYMQRALEILQMRSV